MRAQLEKAVLDCPNPRQLARFYAEFLGMRVFEDSDEWVVLGREPGMRELAFQKADPWVPPSWPAPDHPLVHLDFRVDDVEAAERGVLAAGATRASGTPETGYRVFRDSVGHPFCLTSDRPGVPIGWILTRVDLPTALLMSKTKWRVPASCTRADAWLLAAPARLA